MPEVVALVLRGTVIDSPAHTTLRVREHCLLGVSAEGRIAFCEDAHEEEIVAGGSVLLRDGGEVGLGAECAIVRLPPRGFLCPGLVDTHTHAPQFSFTGTGYDLQLLEWLTTYTFPAEQGFANLSHAARICRAAVRRTLYAGTTSCVYFATIHTEAALQLGRIASGMGQRAFVGKVNMDRNSPPSYVESTAESIAETERFVERMRAEAAEGRSGDVVGEDGLCVACEPKGPPPQPVVTPRFVPTCSGELMAALGRIAAKHGLLVTSHISENLGEVAWVKELHPECEHYAGVYDAAGLLTPRTILAHGVYLTAAERALLKARGSTVSHCPLSNCMLRSGMLNVRRALSEGVHVALGTDVSGGASPSMLTAIREALKVSNLTSLVEKEKSGEEWAPLTCTEAFHLATVGGATTLGVEHLTGHLSVGSICDAVVIDPDADGTPFDLQDADDALTAWTKWITLGDDRNTAEVYVQGRPVLHG